MLQIQATSRSRLVIAEQRAHSMCACTYLWRDVHLGWQILWCQNDLHKFTVVNRSVTVLVGLLHHILHLIFIDRDANVCDDVT